MTRANGRSALFGPPLSDDSAAPRVGGRQALFSAPPRRRGTVVVECSRCDARTPTPVLELGGRLLLSLWMPLRTHSRLMLCPSCRRPAWTRVQWRTLIP